MATMRVCGGFCLLLAALCAAQSPREITFDGLGDSNPGPTFDHGYVVAWDLVHVHSATLYSPRAKDCSTYPRSDFLMGPRLPRR
jgi:hypothetical protein